MHRFEKINEFTIYFIQYGHSLLSFCKICPTQGLATSDILKAHRVVSIHNVPFVLSGQKFCSDWMNHEFFVESRCSICQFTTV